MTDPDAYPDRRPHPDPYAARLDRVLDHIHAHLEEDLSFDRMAEIACLSPWHWSRVYAAMRGETVVATIRRLRLQRAADRLANTGMALAEVASRAGYGSADAFGRAFRDAYGMAPGAYRRAGSHAAFRAATQEGDAAGFPVEIVTLPARRLAAMPHHGDYMKIDRAMGRLISALGAQPDVRTRDEMIGMFLSDPGIGPVEALRSLACLPLEDGSAPPAPPLSAETLRGGDWARLRYVGPYADMPGAYRWLLGTWLPGSGREPADAPIFEAYLDDPRDTAPAALRTDIHLPLRALP
ncbi:MAG: AraC family transcriptional regulator [Rhodobacteraceae bacterium]|nr:AraC family transcriptional regulator [Paracoccaceae bacterium]